MPRDKKGQKWNTNTVSPTPAKGRKVIGRPKTVFLNRRATARYRAWHQLYRAAVGSPGICHFSFLRIVHE